MNKTRTIVALGMAALLSFTMSAASKVFPEDSTPAVTLYLHDGGTIFNPLQKGFIPAGLEQADPTQAAVCTVPAGVDMPATIAEVEAAYGPLPIVKQAMGDFGADQDAIDTLGPLPAEYADYTVVYLDPSLYDSFKSIYIYAFDKDGCAVYKYEATPEFMIAVTTPGDQDFVGHAWYVEEPAVGSDGVAEKPVV